jgi:hypothetical protein
LSLTAEVADDVPFVITLELAGCMIDFKHEFPTTEEINSLKQYCLTPGDRYSMESVIIF